MKKSVRIKRFSTVQLIFNGSLLYGKPGRTLHPLDNIVVFTGLIFDSRKKKTGDYAYKLDEKPNPNELFEWVPIYRKENRDDADAYLADGNEYVRLKDVMVDSDALFSDDNGKQEATLDESIRKLALDNAIKYFNYEDIRHNLCLMF